MTLSKRTKARPKVEPINTSVSRESFARRASKRHSNAYRPLTPISPGTVLVTASRDTRDGTEQGDAAALVNWGRRASEFGLGSAAYCSPKSGLSPSGSHEAGTRAWPKLDATEDADWLCCGTSWSRRQAASVLTAAARESSFQQFREHLWRRGSGEFGRIGDASVMVVPVELKLPSAALSQESQEGGTLAVSGTGLLTVRVGICSKGGKTVALSRTFDLRRLRATIPDPLPSPRSPDFDRNALLAAVSPGGGMPKPPGPASASGPRRPSADSGSGESAGPSPAWERRRGVCRSAVPIHLCYARAFLPVLAAIMVSPMVGSGDRVYLPMPQPAAWRETAAYAYTGQAELLTEQVRQNVLHLGGKV